MDSPRKSASLGELQHPILGNFVLPVEIDNPTKISGPQNLTREGWCEEKCRLYLVRVAAWVPRNFTYEDGIRMLHPMLIERFGDENLDLAVGVLEEMIEIEVPPPFPESVYQRWKFHHMQSMENLKLPHAPHSKLIVLKPRITERLKEWRQQNLGIIPRPDLPNRPTFSCVAHLKLWKIEHTMFTSIGGERVSVYHRPTPEELHRGYWDLDYGRGGTYAGRRKLLGASKSDRHLLWPSTTSTVKHIEIDDAILTIKASAATLVANPTPKKEPRDDAIFAVLGSDQLPSGVGTINTCVQALDFLGPRRPDIDPTGFESDSYLDRRSTLSVSSRKSLIEVPLPNGCIPNGSFARKHALLHEDDPLPLEYLHGHPQLTLDEKILKQCIRICGRVMHEVTQLTSSSAWEKIRLQDQEVRGQLARLEVPLSPGLFYDGGEDYKWTTRAMPFQPSSAESIGLLAPSLSGSPERRLRGRERPMSLPAGFVTEQSNRAIPIRMSNTNITSSSSEPLPKHYNQTVVHPEEYSPSPARPAGRSSLFAKLRRCFRHSERGEDARFQKMRGGLHSVGRLDDNSPSAELPHCQSRTTMVANPVLRESSSNTSLHVPLTLRSPLIKAQSTGNDELARVISKPLAALPTEVIMCGLDGASDTFDLIADQNNRNEPQLVQHVNINKRMARDRSVTNRIDSSMDLSSYDHLPPFSPSIPQPEPLDLRKQPSRIRIDPGPQRVNNNIVYDKNHYEESLYPVRTTSLRKGESPTASGTSWNSAVDSLPSPVRETQTTVSSSHRRNRSDTSSAIMGDFIPLGYSQHRDQARTAQRELYPDAPKSHHKLTHAANPYEFEPGTPLFDEARNTTITDFLYQGSEAASRSARNSQTKHGRSENNKTLVNRKPTPIYNPPSKPDAAIHRSESSPTVSQSPFLARRNSTPNLEQAPFYLEGHPAYAGSGRGREVVSDRAEQQQKSRDHDAYSPVGGRANHQPANLTLQSSSLPQRSRHGEKYMSLSSVQDGSSGHSSMKTLDDVSEQSEVGNMYPERTQAPLATTPKKRARSPMKKMFGEHGWLSNSPDLSVSSDTPKRPRSPMKKMFGEHGWLGQSPEEARHLHSQKKPPMTRKDTSFSQVKKTSLMDKIKNKIDELSEKADLSPTHQRPEHEKHAKLAQLSISVGPPEQARTMMEVELMLVHTANKFLMNEFCKGRMAVDSIKKTVDAWKSKGRPAVIEFMYDQPTQRELVAANQHNFRFHGERAADPVRITSMLYNWKQVASVMAVRTFCSPDTVILKLLFDIEQVLELLGGVEPIMLRLQQIRGTMSEMMRVARLKKGAEEIPQARPKINNSTASHSVSSRITSTDDGHRGRKMSSDMYIEKNLL